MSSPDNAKPSARVVADLDFLRGAAAFAVLLSHVVPAVVADRGEAMAPRPLYWLFYAPAAFGRVAVLMFFVLSGYLVSRSVLRSPVDGRFRSYAVARASRILTVFWPALLLTVALDFIGLHWFGHVGLYAGHHPSHALAPSDLLDRFSVRVFVENALFLQTIRAPVLGSNVALWSLSYEAWFYVAFPFALIAAERRSARSTLVALAALLGIAAFVGGMLVSYFSLWMLGVLVAWTELRTNVRFGRTARSFAAFGVVVLCVLHSRLPGEWERDAMVAGAHAFLLATLVLRDPAPARSPLYARIARRLSRVSYSLYLVHVPLVVLLATAFGVGPRTPVSVRAFERVAVIIAAVAVYATFVWWLVERRTPAVRRWLERRWAQTGKSSALPYGSEAKASTR